MKRLLTSAAIVALAVIGVAVGTATSASAAAPSTGALDEAWTKVCATVTPPSTTGIGHGPGEDVYTCNIDPAPFGDVSEGPTTPALEALCRAMGGTYGTDLQNGSGGIYQQVCTIFH